MKTSSIFFYGKFSLEMLVKEIKVLHSSPYSTLNFLMDLLFSIHKQINEILDIIIMVLLQFKFVMEFVVCKSCSHASNLNG